MPNRIFILGPGMRPYGGYPSENTASVVLGPVPFWWWGESEVVVPGRDEGSPARHNMGSERLVAGGPQVDYYRKVSAKHPVLKKLDHYGYSVLEGDDVRAFAELLSDVGSDPDEPNAQLLLLAGRMVERAARIPCMVAVIGD